MASERGGFSALQVAILAGALLVVIVGADVALNRTISLQVEQADDWQTIGQIPRERSDVRHHGTLVEVNRSDEVDFRIVVDNQHLATFEASYEMRHHTERIARGPLAADRLGVSEERFTVTGDTLLPDSPEESGDRSRPVRVDLRLTVDDHRADLSIDVEEVPR
jgi:glutaredoxin-related protein